MESNLINRDSQIIEIDDDVIDLDGAENTPEEVIYEWDAKIRKKLSKFSVADNEAVLGDLMKEYLQSLQDMARNFEDNETLKNKVFCHICFLYSYYVELQCCTPDNYLSNMEDILTLYTNLELEVIRPLKRKDLSKHKYKKRLVSVARKIIHVLTVYLLDRHDHILHVLIKMNTNNISESCSEVLNILYTHFLTKVPAFNLCDESFCRNYIVFQKWKDIRKREEWEGMDKIMYKMFKRTPESVKNSETLRQILMPSSQSTVDIFLNLFRTCSDMSKAYFKHMAAKKNVEMDDIHFNIDLAEDETTTATYDENEEEVQILKMYYDVERKMLNLPRTTNAIDIREVDILRKCKEEFDDDDDVQFIGITMLPKQPVRNVIIHDEDSQHMICSPNKNRELEGERIPIATPARNLEEQTIPIPAPPRRLEEERTQIPAPSRSLEEQTISIPTPPRPLQEERIPISNPSRRLEEERIPIPAPPRQLEEERIPVSTPPRQLEEIKMPTPAPPPRLEEETMQIPTPPPSQNSTKEKSPDLENMNGIARICISSPRTIAEAPTLHPTLEPQPTTESSNSHLTTQPPNPALPSINEANNQCEPPSQINQPKVPLDINNTRPPRPASPQKTSDSVCEGRTVEMKSVEVQAGNIKDYLYNDYGLTTPPFEVTTDEQIARPVEPRLYTDIGQNNEKNVSPERVEKSVVLTRTVEVQVDLPGADKECQYNNYGLTPPNDPHIDDPGPRQETCLYTNIGQSHKDLREEGKTDEGFMSEICPTLQNHGVIQVVDVAQSTETETEVEIDNSEMTKICETVAHDSECNDFDDLAGITNLDAEYDTEEIDVESCPEPDKDTVPDKSATFDIRVNPDLQVPLEPFSGFKTSDQIDTGQKVILNTAPNIDVESRLTASPTELYNGNTVLKPLLSSNRTNGQSKDIVNAPAKIMYTSPQKIRATSLDDFSRFESAIHIQWSKMKENQDFEEILSGPVTKILPAKHNNLLDSQEKLDLFGSISQEPQPSSRSNSPPEMTSPAYEGMDDFRNYFSDSVNGRVPPPLDVRVPQGILKKTNSTKRKNFRIMFDESTCDNSEERRPRNDGVLVPRRVRKDRKLNMEPRVVVERLSFIENKMKKVLNHPPTLRVDYDKTTKHINEKDVVRCISPPRFSWIVNLTSNRQNPGKVDSYVDAYCKKVSSKCEKNKSSCCNQLAEEFTKLNCNAEDKVLNLTIPEVPTAPVDPESEFSNSPTFLQGTDELVQHCLEETSIESLPNYIKKNAALLCDNSNFYKAQACLSETLATASKNGLVQSSKESESDLNLKESVMQLPTAVPDSYDFDKNLKNEVFSKIDWQSLDDSDGETRLPLKKRKLSVANKNENEEQKTEEISYPATPMISIAEVEALHPRKLQTNTARPFKTPAERKEMPPLPVFYNVDSDPSPIITDQFNINNHTYNNPTINYHMNNVPVPFINIPCGSYYSLPPILVPFNNVSNFEQSKVNAQQQESYPKKENRKQGRQRRRH